jgi:hypothetical protein
LENCEDVRRDLRDLENIRNRKTNPDKFEKKIENQRLEDLRKNFDDEQGLRASKI